METLSEGIKFEVLLNSGYYNIQNICQEYPSFAQICQKESFWVRKAEKDVGVLPKDFALIPGNNKQRYEWIMNTEPTIGLNEANKLGSLSLAKYFMSKGGHEYKF